MISPLCLPETGSPQPVPHPRVPWATPALWPLLLSALHPPALPARVRSVQRQVPASLSSLLPARVQGDGNAREGTPVYASQGELVQRGDIWEEAVSRYGTRSNDRDAGANGNRARSECRTLFLTRSRTVRYSHPARGNTDAPSPPPPPLLGSGPLPPAFTEEKTDAGRFRRD